MDGREPIGISYTPSSCKDPADEPEFNRWYKEVHFMDVRPIGVLQNPIMFHNARTPLPTGLDKFLIMYEVYHQDIAAGMREFSQHTAKLRRDYDGTKGSRSANRGIYRVLHREFVPQSHMRSQSFYAERVDCASPERLEELRRFYLGDRLPALLATGLFHTASFAETIANNVPSAESTGRTRFLALFESSSEDAAGIASQIADRFPQYALPPFVRVAECVAAKRDSA